MLPKNAKQKDFLNLPYKNSRGKGCLHNEAILSAFFSDLLVRQELEEQIVLPLLAPYVLLFSLLFFSIRVERK